MKVYFFILLKGNTRQVPQADQSHHLQGFALPYFQFVKRFTFSNCPNTFGFFSSSTCDSIVLEVPPSLADTIGSALQRGYYQYLQGHIPSRVRLSWLLERYR